MQVLCFGLLFTAYILQQIEADHGFSGCEGPSYMTTSPGVIRSQASTQNHYGSNKDCTWRIHAPVGKIIRLSSQRFHVEDDNSCSYDSLTIYDGRTASDKVVSKYCGSRDIDIVSSGRYLYLEFISDGSDNYSGFVLNFRFISASDSCGGTDHMCQNHKCIPNSYVCDGNNDCGDHSDEDNCNTGSSCSNNEFECTDHSCIPDTWKCDGDNDCGDGKDEQNCVQSNGQDSGCGSPTLQQGTNGSFSSAHYPNHYENMMSCRWEIHVLSGQHVHLDFGSNFHVEEGSSSGNCDYDRVVVYDGNNLHVVGRYCGSSSPGSMTLSSNVATVTFSTDHSSREGGFRINWSAVNTGPTQSSSSCNRDIHFTSPGFITSPGFGLHSLYPPDVSCEYRLYAPDGYVVRLHFNDFGLEGGRHCRYDFVKINDGATSSGTELANRCGNNIPPDAVSKTHIMHVTFTTDHTNQDIGFNATYSYERVTASSVTHITDNACHSGTAATLSNTTGTIISEGYPSATRYPDNLNCRWLINAPPGKEITFTFHDFDLERDSSCSFDFVKIYNGASSHSPLAKNLCGINYPNKWTSSSNHVYVRFVTDDSEGGHGFNITYSIHDPIPTCSPVQFTCSNGDCIDSNDVCDGHRDCPDGADEIICGSSACGLPAIQPSLVNTKIVGGREAIPNSWPWQASLREGYSSTDSKDHMCGGTLIAPQWVVTAAHCFEDDRSPRHWEVALGKHNLVRRDPHQVVSAISKIIVHERYDPDLTSNDITLVKLASPVTLGKYINVACIPTQPVTDGLDCYTTGFGDTLGTGASNLLKQANVPIINLQLCNSTSYLDGEVLNNMICAGYSKGGKDSCQGDSGGPLVCKLSNKWQLEGITSWGVGCGDPHEPGVYTRVFQYVHWIQENIAANS